MKEIKIQKANEIIYEHTCKNGLKVYIWKYDLSEEIVLTFNVKYGSIHTSFNYKDKEINVPNGIAHFLEHIKFNEGIDKTAHDYFYKMGSYTNAYTTYDHTSYEVICNENVKDNLEHLLYFVLNPYFTKGIIQKEKSIIIEEAKSVLDNPYNIGYFTILNNVFHKDKHKNIITGNPEDVKKITLGDIEKVYDAFYHPKNMFLSVCGNVNPYEVIKIVEEYFDNVKTPKYYKPEIITEKEDSSIRKAKEEVFTNVTKEKLFLGFKIPKKGYKKYDDLHLRILISGLMNINFGTTSLFNEELIQNNIIDDLYYTVNVDEQTILILFESSTSYPKEVAIKIKEKMQNLECDEKDFERKKKAMIAGTILGYDNAEVVNNSIVIDIVRYDGIINNTYDIYKSLKMSDVNFIINKLKKAKSSEVILKPNKKETN